MFHSIPFGRRTFRSIDNHPHHCLCKPRCPNGGILLGIKPGCTTQHFQATCRHQYPLTQTACLTDRNTNLLSGRIAQFLTIISSENLRIRTCIARLATILFDFPGMSASAQDFIRNVDLCICTHRQRKNSSVRDLQLLRECIFPPLFFCSSFFCLLSCAVRCCSFPASIVSPFPHRLKVAAGWCAIALARQRLEWELLSSGMTTNCMAQMRCDCLPSCLLVIVFCFFPRSLTLQIKNAAVFVGVFKGPFWGDSACHYSAHSAKDA